MQKTNPILGAKAGGAATMGVWLTVGNTFVAELMGRLGFDWVIIDRQHGSIEWSEVGRCIQAIELSGSPALVRVDWNSPELIMRALDLGAAGVVVPMVSTAEEARRASQAARYPPQGIRSFGPTRSYYAIDAGRPPPACIAMIETREALRNLQQIVAVPGIDALFVGPADLGLDMGVPITLPMHEKVLQEIDNMVSACEAHGVLSGAASFNLDNAKDFIRRGVKVVTVSADIAYLRRGAQPDADYCKSLRKEKEDD
jgi:4-hydroxy-2-oxoheptanedioate aldolase